ncbi:hypothetical protein [Streptomyces sp. SID13031]|uniref:hypothetical protein n=1 Tax=Streptomyces sp. SID13031 TaxID=2706046 RepID=UPI0013CACBE8|nr:hypothetical protein [Streptomyces sp. SID13031]NEA35315.1 hypothetical protein [Streptomyces sp. SID13031]
MNSTPQLQEYELDQRLLEHPLAEIWRGRSFTGMEIVALILSQRGAADAEVRERLGRASRTAALEPGRLQTPLWAANLTASRPYAVTQLVPGQSGAERLLDPLDGLLGNDEESLGAVRSQLAQYGALPIPAEYGAGAEPAGGAESEVWAGSGTGAEVRTLEAADTGRSAQGGSGQAGSGHAGSGQGDSAHAGSGQPDSGQVGPKQAGLGWGVRVAVGVVVLVVFCVFYSVGAKVGVEGEEGRSVAAASGGLVRPGVLPSPGLLPGIVKPKAASYIPPVPAPALVGASYTRGADVQQVTGLGLPFVFGWPRPPSTVDLGTSATTLYRRVLTESTSGAIAMDTHIALHPCATLAACLADRPAFDRDWTTAFKAPTPATTKDASTWITVQQRTPYTVTMTHAFGSDTQYWLVGVSIAAAPGEEPAAQRVLNDIWRQTQ